MIEVKNITKYYGKKLAVDNLSFSIKKGEVVGLLGTNGSGKSTTMKMMAGHLVPSTGTVTVDGVNIHDTGEKTCELIGFSPEIPPLYPDMTIYEYLLFMANIRGVKKSTCEDHIAEILELVEVTKEKKRLIRNLSKGFKQRVGIAQSLIGYPPILILDEPTAGLDPKQTAEIRKLIHNLREKHTILISSHIISEISSSCERVIIIDNGRLIADKNIADLQKENSSANQFVLRTKGANPKNILLNIKGLQLTELEEQKGEFFFEISFANGTDRREELFYLLAENKTAIIELSPITPTLEKVFLSLTKIVS